MYSGHRDQYWGHITYSQHGDDMMILNLFRMMGVKNPSYLDLGCNHPVNISNTALLYSLGSRGVNVDANPNVMDLFNQMRPEDKNIHCGVGIVEGDMELLMVDDKSGLNTLSVMQSEKIAAFGFKITKKITVPVVTLDRIIKEHFNGFYPDLLTVDIEGFDFSVLSSADFSLSKPKVIVAEAKPEAHEAFVKMLDGKGFIYYCRMGENMFFYSKDFAGKVL